MNEKNEITRDRLIDLANACIGVPNAALVRTGAAQAARLFAIAAAIDRLTATLKTEGGKK